jgi:hypothetical protein
MKKPAEGISCYEVMKGVSPVTDELFPGTPVFLMGGGPAAAIRHPKTYYDHENRRIAPAADSAESSIRDNGTRRDLDLLVFRVLEKGEAKAAEKAILEEINERMVVSVFGLDARRQPRPIFRLVRSLADWTSRRTIDEQGVHRYEIYPLEQVLPEAEAVYEEWKMELPGGKDISIMSPDTTVLNYDVRPVSPRHKDQAKLRQMKMNILTEPQFVERMNGPLRPVSELAEAILALGQGELSSDSPMLVDGVTIFGRGAFRARAAAHTFGGRHEKVVKFIGHNEAVQKTIKFTTGRK